MVDPEALTTIAGACRDRERLRFAYRSREAQDSRRHVEPHSLVNLGRRWYLVAWDCDREDWRTFRVDRLERPAPAGGRFEPRTLPAARIRRRTSPRACAPRRRATRRASPCTRRPPSSSSARYLWGTVEAIDEDRCEYRTSDDSLDWLAMRIGMLGVDFEVHEPPELVARFEQLAARFGQAGDRGAIANAPGRRRVRRRCCSP